MIPMLVKQQITLQREDIKSYHKERTIYLQQKVSEKVTFEQNLERGTVRYEDIWGGHIPCRKNRKWKGHY